MNTKKLLLLLAALFAFAFVAHAADGTSTGTISSASISGVLLTPGADGTVLISGLPPAWQAIWLKILSIAGTVVMLARIAVKLTPTPKDDTILDSVVTFLTHLGLSTPTPTPAKLAAAAAAAPAPNV